MAHAILSYPPALDQAAVHSQTHTHLITNTHTWSQTHTHTWSDRLASASLASSSSTILTWPSSLAVISGFIWAYTNERNWSIQGNITKHHLHNMSNKYRRFWESTHGWCTTRTFNYKGAFECLSIHWWKSSHVCGLHSYIVAILLNSCYIRWNMSEQPLKHN